MQNLLDFVSSFSHVPHKLTLPCLLSIFPTRFETDRSVQKTTPRTIPSNTGTDFRMLRVCTLKHYEICDSAIDVVIWFVVFVVRICVSSWWWRCQLSKEKKAGFVDGKKRSAEEFWTSWQSLYFQLHSIDQIRSGDRHILPSLFFCYTYWYNFFHFPHPCLERLIHYDCSSCYLVKRSIMMPVSSLSIRWLGRVCDCSGVTCEFAQVLLSMAYFFASAIDVDIKLEGEELRKQVEIKSDKDKNIACPVYYDGDSVTGQVRFLLEKCIRSSIRMQSHPR